MSTEALQNMLLEVLRSEEALTQYQQRIVEIMV